MNCEHYGYISSSSLFILFSFSTNSLIKHDTVQLIHCCTLPCILDRFSHPLTLHVLYRLHSCVLFTGSCLNFFCRCWSLKEAFVKALGAGLGYGLHRLEFHHNNWTHISVDIDGVKSTEWRFWHFKIDNLHFVSLLCPNLFSLLLNALLVLCVNNIHFMVVKCNDWTNAFTEKTLWCYIYMFGR